MPQLFAKFSLEVPASCLLEIADKQKSIQLPAISVGEFSVTVSLVPATGWGLLPAGSNLWTRGLDLIEVVVSRDEADSPPAVIHRADGTCDLTEQQEYLYGKHAEYRYCALEAANRVLRYFRDQLFTPGIRLYGSWTHALNNPVWTDCLGAELCGMGMSTLQYVSGQRGEMGVGKLSLSGMPALHSFIQSPIDPSLEQTLLSDAQTAWFEGNIRRAVLELAICAEVVVKRRFFAASSPAGAAFDYLEDKAKVSVRVLDLIDTIALAAFSQSYKQISRANYDCIDFLFRCRNKVAHRGELSYRDDSGNNVSVDKKTVEAWWHAVAHLRDWMQSLR